MECKYLYLLDLFLQFISWQVSGTDLSQRTTFYHSLFTNGLLQCQSSGMLTLLCRFCIVTVCHFWWFYLHMSKGSLSIFLVCGQSFHMQSISMVMSWIWLCVCRNHKSLSSGECFRHCEYIPNGWKDKNKFSFAVYSRHKWGRAGVSLVTISGRFLGSLQTFQKAELHKFRTFISGMTVQES